MLGITQARADGGAYTLTLRGADPANYDRKMPGDLACPTPGGGVAFNPLPWADYTSGISSLAPGHMALGQIVPYELRVKVSGDTRPENGIIKTKLNFATETTSSSNFGFDAAYKVYCAFIDISDSAQENLDGNESVSFTTSILPSRDIQGEFTIFGLDTGDTAILEIWLVLDKEIPAGTSGNVAGKSDSTETILGDKISVGTQTIPLLKTQDFFISEADIKVQKMDAPDPTEPLQSITYSLEVNNLSTSIVANSVVTSDTLDADTSFVSLSVNDTEGASPSCTHDGSATGGVISCNLNYLNPLETVKITVVVKVNVSAPLGTGGTGPCSSAEPICNTVIVQALNDSILSNNTASQPTGVSY